MFHVHAPAAIAFGYVTPGTVMVGGWRTTEHDVGPDEPNVVGHLGRVWFTADLESVRDERRDTASDFSHADASGGAAGFGYVRGSPSPPPVPSFVEAYVPTCFAVAVLLAPMALLTVRRLRRGRRVAVGARASCGYDLRATPGRCPECGAVPA